MKNLKKSYIIALSLIALFTIISQVVIQLFLIHQVDDAEIINITGRQRMLSQKIAKHGLIISKTNEKDVFQYQQKKLLQTFQLWYKSHNLLIAGNDTFLVKNSKEIQNLFEKLEPFRKHISESTQKLLKTDFHTSSQVKNTLIQDILDNETSFLYWMNKIVLQHELESKNSVNRLSSIEKILMSITILILLLEAFLIFRPIIHKSEKYVEQIQGQNEELRVQEEELKQNLEELHSIQEDLENRQAELRIQSEKRLVLNTVLETSLKARESIDVFLQQVIQCLAGVTFLKFLPGIGIFIKNEEGSFQLKAHKDLAPEIQEKCAFIEAGKCLCGLAIEQKITQYAYCLDERYTTRFEGIEEHGHYNVPIIFEGEALGALVVYLRHGHRKNESEIKFLENITATIANTINNFNSKEKITQKNEDLLATDEELRQNLEELTAIQENLEQKQVELQIALAENTSINHALDNSAIVSITDLKGNILHVNDIFCEISGFTKSEMLGKNQNIVNSGYHPQEFWKELWRTIGTGNTWRGEVRNKTKEGSIYWVDAVVNPMYDGNGKIYRYLSVRYLITDKKKNQDKIIKINDDLSASIQYAQRIQSAILVRQEDIKKTLPDSFIFFKPRDVVSGDFYFYAQKKYKTVIAAVDCTGHGIPGAFMSLIANNILQEVVNNKGITAPDKVLNLLKVRVIETLKQKENKNQDGMDIAICSIDRHPEDMEEYLGVPKLEYAGAANPLIYFQNGEMTRVRGDKIIIGGFRNYLQESSFQKYTIPLEVTTTFYIFSDGIQDQFGAHNKRKFSPRRLRELLGEIHQEPMEKQKEIIDKTIIEWQGKENQIDDMLLIGVRLDI